MDLMLMVYKLNLGVGHEIKDDNHASYDRLYLKKRWYLPVVYATTGFVGCITETLAPPITSNR